MESSRISAGQTFILRRYIADDHKVASAFAPECIFWAFFKLPCVLVPCYNGIVKGHFTFKSCRLSFPNHNVLDAFSEMYLLR